MAKTKWYNTLNEWTTKDVSYEKLFISILINVSFEVSLGDDNHFVSVDCFKISIEKPDKTLKSIYLHEG